VTGETRHAIGAWHDADTLHHRRGPSIVTVTTLLNAMPAELHQTTSLLEAGRI
jgi:hypothetical protein